MTVLLDTGPWVALLSRNDTHHQWAVEQFRLLPPPMLSCEAVVAETCFLLKRSGFDPSLALQFIERDAVQLSFTLQEQIASVSSLFKRYENVPASLADAALIRMATGGAGLGLAVARQAARAAGGDVTLTNRPGGGLEARLALPLSS